MSINTAFAGVTSNETENGNIKIDTDKTTNDRIIQDKLNDKTTTNSVIGVKPSDPSQIDNTMADSMSPWTSLIPIALMFSVFYWFLIRPQEKRRREQEELIKSVKTGDKVITAGGIHGIVSRVIDDNTIDLEIAQNTNIRMMKSAILEIPSRNTSSTVVN